MGNGKDDHFSSKADLINPILLLARPNNFFNHCFQVNTHILKLNAPHAPPSLSLSSSSPPLLTSLRLCCVSLVIMCQLAISHVNQAVQYFSVGCLLLLIPFESYQL